MSEWKPIGTLPSGKAVLLIAPYPTGNGHWSDPYYGWRFVDDDSYARWPHSFPPTHWLPVSVPNAPIQGDDA